MQNINGKSSWKALLLAAILLAAVLWGVPALADVGEPSPAGILLSWTGDSATTQTFTWTDQEGLTTYVQYVTATEYRDRGFAQAGQSGPASCREIRTAAGGSFRYEATISGLEPDSKYYYRVGAGETWSEPASFRTADPGLANFAFVYLGDIQVYADMEAELAAWGELAGQAVDSYELSFGLLGGDIVEDGGNLANWNAFLSQAGAVFAGTPLLAANGNHESNYVSGKPESYLDIFAFPENGPAGFKEEFYSFDYGNCHVLVLNSHVFSGEQHLDEAALAGIAEWIDEDLSYSTAAWSIVLLHHPVYALASDAVSAQVREEWSPLFEANGVDLVLEGHQHVYSRSYPLYQGSVDYTRGITYVMGNSGAKSYTSADETYSAKTIYGIPTYQIVEIDGSSLYLSTYDADGSRLDYFALSAKAKPGRVLLGDANGDGLVDAADLAPLLLAIRNNAPYSQAMDLNGDGTVDVLDAHSLYLQVQVGGGRAMKRGKSGLVKFLATLLLAFTLQAALSGGEAAAKTITSAPAEQLFFYVTNDQGQDVLLKIVSLEALEELSHGQLSQVLSGEDTEVDYYYAYTDNLPATGYAEAAGFTLPELVEYIKGVSPAPGAATIAYSGGDIMSFMATDSQGSYMKSWSYNTLYGVTRYYFPGMLDTANGWQRGWELTEDIAKYGISLEEYNATYKNEDNYYQAKRNAFSTGTETAVILAVDSYAGRTAYTDGGTEAGLLELIEANNGVVTGCLADVLDRECVLRLLIPLTEADLMCAHRTAYDHTKWIYNIRLNMAAPPAVVAAGTVAAPIAQVAVNGDTMTLTLSCTTPGAEIYYSVRNSDDALDSAGAPQTLYDDPIQVDISGRDLNASPVRFDMTAVREGWADAGIVNSQYPLAAPAFKTVYSANIGQDLKFEATGSVSSETWLSWTGALSGIGYKGPGDSDYRVLSAARYQINHTAKVITVPLDAAVFDRPGSYSFIFYAAGYADTQYSTQLYKAAPVLRAASAYVLGQPITISFDDAYYQSNATVKVTPPGSETASSINPQYLDRTVPGKLSIKASYFGLSSCKIKEAGVYKLTVINGSYISSNQDTSSQDIYITVIDAEDLPIYSYDLAVDGEGPLALGDGVGVTLRLQCDQAFRLYGGQYRLVFDSSALELDPSSVNSIWPYGVSVNQASGLTTLTFVVLAGAGQDCPLDQQAGAALLDIASFTLIARESGSQALTPTVYLLTDQDASARLNVSANPAEITVAGGDDYVLGDTDGDGFVTAADAIGLCRYLVGYVSLPGSQLLAADVDGDGDVTIADVIMLLRYLVGYLESLEHAGNPLSFTAFSLFAAEEAQPVSVSVSSVVAEAGGSVTLPVMISNNPGLAGLSLEIVYDRSAMTLTGVEQGPVLSGGIFAANQDQALICWGNAENVAADGRLFNLTFAVKEQSVNGSHAVSLSLRDGNGSNFCDENGGSVALLLSSGLVTVMGGVDAALSGDVSSGGGSGGGSPNSGPGNSGPGSNGGAGFVDVPADAWYAGAVAEVTARQLFQGLSEHTFGPGLAMSRAMLVTVLWRIEGRPAAAPAFADVPAQAWYYGAVGWAAQGGVVQGYPDGRFGPLDNITRAQLAVILYRYTVGLDQDTSLRGDVSIFSDRADIPAWAAEAMSWAVGRGLLQGGNGRLEPQALATRAEVAAIIWRFLTVYGAVNE